MSVINLQNIRQAEGLYEELADVRSKIESRINLQSYSSKQKPVILNNNKVMRICLLAGLQVAEKRDLALSEQVQMSKNGNRIFETLFTRHNLSTVYSALLKIRYNNINIDWENNTVKSKIINFEIIQGANYLVKEDSLDDYLLTISNSLHRGSGLTEIPFLNLNIGNYEDDIPALLNLNGKNITNTQILIAGTTGSGKSNLLAVLINEIRALSIETPYPVNFLLFDYKGEFSDPANNGWLSLFETDRSAILDPITSPLPFTPFKEFVGRPQNEINLYANELSNAIAAIDRSSISANMGNRLAEAVINAYKRTQNKAISFELILKEYVNVLVGKDKEKDDSISSVLKQLIRTNLFSPEDKIDLIKGSYIVKMDGFPKDGPIAKAIVYFIVSKLNTIYEQLPKTGYW